MAIVNKKPARRVGVGAQYLCFGDPEINIPYETEIIKNETVTSIEVADGGGGENVWASNKIYDVDKSGDTTTLTVENLAFDPKDLARIKGERVDGAFTFSSNLDEGEHFAYGIVYPKKTGFVRFVWYPRCIVTEVTDSAQTMDDSGPNSQNPTLTIQTLPFNDNGEYRVIYDTEMLNAGETAMAEEDFFAQVLTEVPAVVPEP